MKRLWEELLYIKNDLNFRVNLCKYGTQQNN